MSLTQFHRWETEAQQDFPNLVPFPAACFGLTPACPRPGLECLFPRSLDHRNESLTILLGLAWSPGCIADLERGAWKEECIDVVVQWFPH